MDLQKPMWRQYLFILFLTLSLALVGCSSSSDSTTTDNTGGGDNTTDTTYTGTTTLSGSIELSSLTSQDKQALNKAKAVPQRTLLADNGTEIIILSYVDENGELQDTGIECTITPVDDNETAYSCPNIADNLTYVIRYVQLLGGGKAIEMTATATVPDGATTVDDVTVDPITTMIVDAVIDAVIEATQGLEVDAAVVEKLIANVKTAVTTAVQSMVTSGLISIPSMVVETTVTDVNDLKTTKTNNENLADTSGLILSDDTVNGQIQLEKSDIEEDQLAGLATDSGALVQRIFNEMMEGDGEGPPQWMIDFLADKAADGVTITVQELGRVILEGMELRTEDLMKIYDESTFTAKFGAYVIDQDGEYVFTESFRTQLLLDALTEFSTGLSEILAIKAKKDAGTALTEEEKDMLREVPPVIHTLFNQEFLDSYAQNQGATVMGIPRGIAFVIFVMDFFIEDHLMSVLDINEDDLRFADGNSEGDNVKFEVDYIQITDFNPFPLFLALTGISDPDLAMAELLSYAEPEIEHFETHVQQYWYQGTPGDEASWTFKEILEVEACFSDMTLWFMDNMTQAGAMMDVYKNASVTLTYPNALGTAVTTALYPAEFMSDPGFEDAFFCFYMSPWPRVWEWSEEITDNASRVIEDFGSGTFTVNVTAGDTVITRSYERFLLTGLYNYFPTLTTPKSFPMWPGTENHEPTQAEIDAFNLEMQAFEDAGGMTRFAPAVGQDNVTGFIVRWKAPDLSGVELPDYIKLGYALSIGQGTCIEENVGGWCDRWDWEEYFSSWRQDRFLFGTMFQLPPDVTIPVSEQPYDLNLDLIFIDKRTGMQVAHGGNAHAQFIVGEALNDNASMNLWGAVENIALTDLFWDADNATDNWKIGLFTERWNQDTQKSTRTMIATYDVDDLAESDNYTLNVTVGDVRAAQANGGGWVGIAMFNDKNDDDAITEPSPNDLVAIWEEVLWPEGTGFHFDTWGGTFVVRVEKCPISEEGWTEWGSDDCERKEFKLTNDNVTTPREIHGPDFNVEFYKWKYPQEGEFVQ